MGGLIPYKQRKRMGWELVILIIIVFFVIAAAFGLEFTQWSNTSTGQQTLSLWFGDKSLFDLVSSAVTMIATIVAGFLAFRSYETNRRAAIANRYQKGVELLAAPADSSKLGGVELLSVVATEAPKEYQVPVIRTLRQFLQERCSSRIQAILAGGEVSAAEIAADTDFVVMTSLSAIARTDFRKRWIAREDDEAGLPLFGIYLQKMHFFHVNFSRLWILESIFGDVTFEFCTFRETTLNIKCSGRIIFKDCTLDNFEIVAADIAGKRLEDTKSFIKVSGSQRPIFCRVNGQRI